MHACFVLRGVGGRVPARLGPSGVREGPGLARHAAPRTGQERAGQAQRGRVGWEEVAQRPHPGPAPVVNLVQCQLSSTVREARKGDRLWM